jgi:hypothetical protein
MKALRQVWMGYTAQANTPETDAVPQVLHHVTVRIVGEGLEHDEKVELLAIDPQDAMEKVRTMSDVDYGRLKRVPMDQWEKRESPGRSNSGGVLH